MSCHQNNQNTPCHLQIYQYGKEPAYGPGVGTGFKWFWFPEWSSPYLSSKVQWPTNSFY